MILKEPKWINKKKVYEDKINELRFFFDVNEPGENKKIRSEIKQIKNKIKKIHKFDVL